MSERVKERREVVYFYDDLENLVKEVETRFEPSVEEAAPEFAGVTETASFPHGQVPAWPEGERSVYKVYEKVTIWLRRPVKGVA